MAPTTFLPPEQSRELFLVLARAPIRAESLPSTPPPAASALSQRWLPTGPPRGQGLPRVLSGPIRHREFQRRGDGPCPHC